MSADCLTAKWAALKINRALKYRKCAAFSVFRSVTEVQKWRMCLKQQEDIMISRCSYSEFATVWQF